MKKTKKRTTKAKVYKPKEEKLVTLVNYILDQSGSMNDVKNQVLSGFAEYLTGLKKQMASESELYFSLTLFDSDSSSPFGGCNVRLEKPYLITKIEDVRPLSESSYRPRGMTPLYDAIGASVKTVEKALKKELVDVLCVIMTDGQENCSREFTRSKIFEIIAEKQKEGWTFAYLGANQDSWGEGSKVGIAGSNTMDFAYDSAGVTRAFASTMAATDRYFVNRANSGRSQMVSNTSYYANMEELESDVKKYEKKIKERDEKDKK